ncbi:MAG: porin [Pseudolabrys sp.]|nr:porin [Pseudolabrys sp.]
MKMVKSLLLGTAAGLVAMTGAQAADLPVKAKPVQYVKICSLYGAGFYYIPGTDTCIKVGGFVRTEWQYNAAGSLLPDVRGTNFTRANADLVNRTRFVASFDTRSQTEYGTLRSYFVLGMQTTNAGGGSNIPTWAHRGFIQLAGFTAGLSTSFFDGFSFSAYSNQTNIIGSDVGGGGIPVVGYTAQLGNGLSASVAIEDTSVRRTAIVGGGGYGGAHLPDFVANLRVDQAWGNAQIMGALHEVYPGYVTTPTIHHDNKLGYAVGASVKFNLPMLGKGDNIGAQVAYAKGATGYNQLTYGAAAFATTKGGNTVSGTVEDAVCGTIAQGCELTSSWSVAAAYQHGWNSQWKTSLYGGYTESTHSSTAETILSAGSGGLDYSLWQMGSRTVWTPVKNLDLSMDVIYTNLKGAPASQVGSDTTSDVWAGIIRAQRNFWP